MYIPEKGNESECTYLEGETKVHVYDLKGKTKVFV